jgi:hypothetical protein
MLIFNYPILADAVHGHYFLVLSFYYILGRIELAVIINIF